VEVLMIQPRDYGGRNIHKVIRITAAFGTDREIKLL